MRSQPTDLHATGPIYDILPRGHPPEQEGGPAEGALARNTLCSAPPACVARRRPPGPPRERQTSPPWLRGDPVPHRLGQKALDVGPGGSDEQLPIQVESSPKGAQSGMRVWRAVLSTWSFGLDPR